MADVAPGIITFGLGGDQTGLIIGNIFNLGFFRVDVGIGSPIIPDRPRDQGGGGSFPLRPGEIKNFYKVVNNQWQVPYVYPKNSKVPVYIKIKFGKTVVERHYLVNPKRSDMIIQVINLVNRVRDKYQITIKNIKSMKNRIGAIVTNIRKKD